MFKPCWVVLLSALFLGGCTQLTSEELMVLNERESFELYSIDPFSDNYLEEPNFHHWRILGKTSVADRATRDAIVIGLKTATESSVREKPYCFDPAYGIRVRAGGKVYDFAICLKSYRIRSYLEDKKIRDFAVDRSIEPLLDKVLTDAGVMVAPKKY